MDEGWGLYTTWNWPQKGKCCMIPLTWDTYNSQRSKEWNSWWFWELRKRGNGQLLNNRHDVSVKQRWVSLDIHYTSLSLWFPIMDCTHKYLVSREISYQLFLSQWNKILKETEEKDFALVEFAFRGAGLGKHIRVLQRNRTNNVYTHTHTHTHTHLFQGSGDWGIWWVWNLQVPGRLDTLAGFLMWQLKSEGTWKQNSLSDWRTSVCLFLKLSTDCTRPTHVIGRNLIYSKFTYGNINLIFNWGIVDLQYGVSFRYTTKWFSYL